MMVDILSLCQLYESQEITKIMWIYRYHNLANSITKVKPLLALKTLIDINLININTTECIEWANMKQTSTKI